MKVKMNIIFVLLLIICIAVIYYQHNVIKKSSNTITNNQLKFQSIIDTLQTKISVLQTTQQQQQYWKQMYTKLANQPQKIKYITVTNNTNTVDTLKVYQIIDDSLSYYISKQLTDTTELYKLNIDMSMQIFLKYNIDQQGKLYRQDNMIYAFSNVKLIDIPEYIKPIKHYSISALAMPGIAFQQQQFDCMFGGMVQYDNRYGVGIAISNNKIFLPIKIRLWSW